MRASSMVSPESFIAEATFTSAKSHAWRSRTFSKWKRAPAQVAGIRIAVRRSEGPRIVILWMSVAGVMK
jgi:hypothetical protein